MVIKVGPAGCSREIGAAWDESECGDLVQIFISHDTDKIYSLQFQYVVDGTLMLSKRYGESHGLKFDTVQLNYPSEFITGVDGHFSINDYKNSFTFHTNEGTYGPFGCPKKDKDNANKYGEFKFHTGQEHNQFGGFHGRVSDGAILSIGVYIKPLTAIPNISPLMFLH